MSLHIEYLDAPDGVQDNITLGTVTNLETGISDTSKIEGTEAPFATLEPGVWKLDGTRQLLSGDKDVFLWGEPGETLSFTIEIPDPTSISGITFQFSESTNQWPKKVSIAWYLSGIGVTSVDYTPTSPVLIAEANAENFFYASISVYPKDNERVKIRKITLGRELSFGKGELENVNAVSESDPSLLTVTADTLSFDVIVKDGMLLSPMEGHQVKLFKNGVQQCVQFVKDFERIRKNSYSIVCQSLIGKLENTHYGRFHSAQYNPDYDKDGRRTPGSLAAEIADGHPVDVSGLPTDIALAGYLETQTQRDALRQLAFAVGRSIYTKGGFISFVQIPNTVSFVFGNDTILKTHRIKQMADYTGIRLYSQSFKHHGYGANHVEISSGSFVSGDLIETDRMWGTLTDGNTTLAHDSYEKGFNWIRMKASYTGDICGGSSYDIVKNYEERVLTSTGKTNILSVDGATLVNNSQHYYDYNGTIYYEDSLTGDVFDRLEAFAKLNLLVEQDVVVTTQQAGDYVRTVTPWDETVEGYIISMDSKLTQNGHTARIKILGKKVS